MANGYSKNIVLLSIAFSINCQAGLQSSFASFYTWIFGYKQVEPERKKRTEREVNRFEKMDKDCNEFVNNSSTDDLFKKINPSDYSPENKALYNFRRKMQALEEKWHNWHINFVEKNVKGRGQIIGQYMFHEFLDKKNKPIRFDINSPYYRRIQSNKKNYLSGFSLRNADENKTYHDELQFMKTQLALMKMYKTTDKINPENQYNIYTHDIKNEENRNKAYTTLKNEYKWFKSDSGRKAFTRSCMKKTAFETLSKLREIYKPEVLQEIYKPAVLRAIYKPASE